MMSSTFGIFVSVLEILFFNGIFSDVVEDCIGAVIAAFYHLRSISPISFCFLSVEHGQTFDSGQSIWVVVGLSIGIWKWAAIFLIPQIH